MKVTLEFEVDNVSEIAEKTGMASGTWTCRSRLLLIKDVLELTRRTAETGKTASLLEVKNLICSHVS